MEFEEEPKVQAWKNNIIKHGCKINSIKPLELIYKRNDELLFALCETDIDTPSGEKLPSIIMIRGDAVIVVPLMKNRDTGEERYLLVKQYRIGTGDFELEFPAGMLDRNIHDPLGVAVNELREETGLSITKDDLFYLCPKPLYTSPGLNDERAIYFGCIIDCSNEFYYSFEGKIAGAIDENEKTITTLKTKEEIFSETNGAPVFLAIYLFESYQKNNQLSSGC